MKKLLFIAALALGISTNVNAQANEFGIKGGLNYSDINGDDVAGDPDSRIGWHIGALYHLGINDDFAIQPELLISAKGAEETSLVYADIPLLAHVHATEELTFHFGPQVGFMLSGKNDGEDVSDFYKATDIAAVAGTTYRLETGLFFTLRYNYGISNIGESIDVPTVDPNTGAITTREVEFEASNNVLQVSVGFLF